MTQLLTAVSVLTDTELIAEVKVAAALEREATVRLIALLAQMDARRLSLGEGCSSLFTYCTQVLHLSEHAAYGRIEAARAARRFPVILDLLSDGSITLTTVTLLAPHLHVRQPPRDPRCRASQEQARRRAHRGAPAAAAGDTGNRPQASRGETRACFRSAICRSARAARRFRRGSCATAYATSCHRDATGAGALQSAVHDVTRDARQAAPRTEPIAVLNPERRSRRHLRSSVVAPAGRSRAGEARRDDATR